MLLLLGRKSYLDHTGHCINERLLEHNRNIKGTLSGNLGVHVNQCGCVPQFSQTLIRATSHSRLETEILEAFLIKEAGDSNVYKC